MQVVRTLMENVIDYAGLFPPARLDMDPTVRNYAEYLRGGHAWMLGRLVVPVNRLSEFETFAGSLLPRSHAEIPWQISALTAPADDAAGLDRDLERIAAFNESHADPSNGLAIIDAIELKAGSSEAIEEALDVVPDDITPFFEMSLERDLRGVILAISGNDACAKVRTGGVTPDLFPSPEAVASFIDLCATADVPFKATAGLHHPFTHDSRGVPGAKEFGFVNLFLAAALVKRQEIAKDEAVELLAEEDPGSFHFKDDAIAWREHAAGADQIDETRKTFALSYGSCSFVEPIDDLSAMGLLS